MIKKFSLCILLMVAVALTACANSPASQTLSENLVPYENKELGFKIGIPAVMTESQDTAEGKSLMLVAGNEEFTNNLFIIIQENTDGLTIGEYSEISPLREYFSDTPETDSIMKINNVDFWKIVDHDETPGAEMWQMVYTAFENGLAYEVTVTLTEEYYDANAAVLAELEKSITVTPIN